jgi:hypothetical protein
MSITITFPLGYKPVLKHGDHDQSSHGSWATGITEDLSKWSPKEKVPDSPRNATGTTQKFWDNWEHGVDGDQFVDLYRQYAGEMLGLPVPKSDKDVGGTENYLTQRGFGASSTDAVRNQTEAVLNAIANGRPQPALYRGMAGGSEESKALLEQFTQLKEGDTIDMPLVSTTRSLGVAQWYAVDRSRTPNDSRVILKIQEGAKGVSVNPEKSYYPSDFETITSGKFEVVGKSEVTVPYWDRRATSARTFTLRGDDGQDGKTGYRIDDPNDLSWGSVDSLDPKAKDRYDTIINGAKTGDFSKIETPTIKYTNDRQPSGVKEGRDVTVNSWKRQEPKTFTIIEVKMVEPHVVKKGADLGMTFHNLFNDIPFIRDEEDVKKHGEHDQSSHGSWASGNFDEETQGETAQNTYFDTYGIKTDGSNEPVGISRNQINSLNDYTGEGYTKINAFLRGRGDTGSGSLTAIEGKIPDIDKLIEEAPDLFGDKNLYRVFDKNLVDTLKEGDVLTDKGFMSTTRVDITSKEGSEVLQNLQIIRLTEDRASVILPSESKTGKGLAVDYLKNSVSDLFTNVATANNEKEVLLPRNTSLKFQGYKKLNQGTDDAMEIAVFQRMDK